MRTALGHGSIGILGGGQLGRLLALDAARLGYDVHIYCPDADSPAARVSADRTIAEYDDHLALEQFAKSCAVVTFEFENVPVSAIETIQRFGTEIYPDKHALEKSQDRLIEKTYLNSLGIPTVGFQAIDSSDDLNNIAVENGGFLKRRRFGYDGKGQVYVNNRNELETAWETLGSQPAIFEDSADFESEISVVVARGCDGEVETFEPSENFHEGGILKSSHVPANISQQTAKAAVEATVNLVESLQYRGVLALELFVLRNGNILANEFAPRVHNSGHWTPEACNVGQFEQHIRAIVGSPLIAPRRYHDVEMRNLLGEAVFQYAGDEGYTSYGKRDAIEGRKMGHVVKVIN